MGHETAQMQDAIGDPDIHMPRASGGEPLNLWPLSWPDCVCLWRTQTAISAMRQHTGTHAVIESIRQATATLDELLECSLCFARNRSCFFNIQNLLLFSRLFYHVAKAYVGYSRWLKNSPEISEAPVECCISSNNQTIQLSVSNGDYRKFILLGQKQDTDRIGHLATLFASRQREGHEKDHKNCVAEKCQRLQTNLMDEALAVCPKSEDAVRLIWCYRSIEDVERSAEKLREELAR